MWYVVHPEYNPNNVHATFKLCEYHAAQARDCRMIDAENVDVGPEGSADCACTDCHFCD